MRILLLKLIALVSQFTGHTIRLPYALHLFGSMGCTHSIVIVSDYLQYGKYATNVFLKNHSATSRFNCPLVSGSCHSYFQMVLQLASQFKLGLLLSSITQLGRNGVHDFFATSHCKGPVDGIGGTMKRRPMK